LNAPRDPSQPWSITMRQPFEWSANGRTRLMFDSTGRVVKVDDPARSSRAAAIYEKFLPLHSASVGGLAWKLVMTLSGFGLTILGAFACLSFWSRRAKKRRRPEIARAGLEVAAA
jgi:uncharacterized iron-regulated membrane protein